MYRTTFGEVRNQSDREVRAVCQVIYNRLISGKWGSTFTEVVLSREEGSNYGQFSVWNPRGGQRKRLLDSSVVYHPSYSRVQSICSEVIAERQRGIDTSRGINYFYSPLSMEPRCTRWSRHHRHSRNHRLRCTKWKRFPPSWSYNYEYKVRIGSSIFFYKEI